MDHPPPIFRKRQGAYLPHWTRPVGTYAVTFRLHDSLPAILLASWVHERNKILWNASHQHRDLTSFERDRLATLFSEKVECCLNTSQGECLLRNPAIAALVASALQHFDRLRYNLIAWCIMPNHVHVVLTPLGVYELPAILHTWKSFSAHRANRLLARSGSFWETEYYDHLIRDEHDYHRQISYVLDNPRRAHLPNWPWVSLCHGRPPSWHGRPAHDQAQLDSEHP